MFQEPPITRFDAHFKLFGIPVRVHPLFWLMAIVFGLLQGLWRDGVALIIWILVVFLSITIHELGHSFAMRLFGVRSSIVLHLMGGLAIPDKGQATNQMMRHPLRWVFVSFAGPLAGFLLVALAVANVYALGGWVEWVYIDELTFPFPIPVLAGRMHVAFTIIVVFWVNLFWGLFNLIPVYPLDGGQIARGLFMKWDHLTGLRNSLWLSVVCGALTAFFGLFFIGSGYMAILFGILAFRSYRTLHQYG